MNKKLRANLLLLLTAMLWGASFVFQVSGMEYVGPFTFQGLRLICAAIILIPVIALMAARAKVPILQQKKRQKTNRRSSAASAAG